MLQDSATGLQREAALEEYIVLFCGRAGEMGVSKTSNEISSDRLTGRGFLLRLQLEDGTGGREG